MESKDLFEAALDIQPPLEVVSITFEEAALTKGKALNVSIAFIEGTEFKDSTGVVCEVYDTQNMIWQNDLFFDYPCVLQCAVPRIKTSAGALTLVEVPWSSAKNGFILKS